MERHQPLFVLIALGASLCLHGVAYASLALAPRAPGFANPTSEMEFEVAPAAPPPPAEPEPPPPVPRPVERVAAPVRPVAARAEPPPEAKAPRAAAPVDLSGVTLSNESGDASWTSAAGNGGRMQGPLGPVAARSAAAVAPAAPAARAPAAPALVAAADLSERPRPPALDSVLRRHVPEEAKQRGVSGTASVRARIEPDGRARQLRVVSESFAGFGEACRRTLQGSRWSPPRDRLGNAVATEIAYTCRFVVER